MANTRIICDQAKKQKAFKSDIQLSCAMFILIVGICTVYIADISEEKSASIIGLKG